MLRGFSEVARPVSLPFERFESYQAVHGPTTDA